ncbi:hypothetical protein DQ237_10220 [Blastococcus sp. TF02-8]|uniref:VanZ family protein n=1 Tax=Blastococcus sp. TF02-8 TaxID=2250574 RepID=UPI000DEBD853|nr:VanZ family protein [Blastococcus sp. TF02-8]RBY96229.1 hypothetical protein DQ237_10220 [Blastococcus sp. TF02-8]
MSRRVAVLGLAAYLGLLASVTLGASPGALFVRGARLSRDVGGFEWVTTSDVERVANVLLFAPAGLLLCFALPGVARLVVWLLCVAASMTVEVAQIFLPDRRPSLVDVATNATGAAVGVLAAVVLGWFARRRQRVRQQ